MIQQETRLKIADNTGAKEVLVIRNLSNNSPFALVGDIVKVTVKKAIPSSLLKKGSVVRAVIVRSKQPLARADGTVVRFDENAAVIIGKNDLNPRGTRIFGPVANELKKRGFTKIVSLVGVVL